VFRWLQRWQRQRLGSSRDGPTSPRLAVAAETAGQRRSWLIPVGAAGLLVCLHLIFFPPVARLGLADLPEVGGIAEQDVRAPFAFAARLPDQEVEIVQMQKVLEEPPVLRRLDPSQLAASVGRLRVFTTALREARALTNRSVKEKRQLLAAQFPHLDEAEIERALTTPDPAALTASLEAALQEVVASGVADMLPPGQYNRVLVVDHQAEDLRELTAVTPQNRLLEGLTEALRRTGLAPADAVWAASLLRRFAAPNLIYDAEETRLKQDLARQSVPTTREFIQNEKIVGAGDRITEHQGLFLDALRERLRSDAGGAGGAGRRALTVITRLLILALILSAYGWLAWVYFPGAVQSWRRLLALVIVLGLGLAAAALALGNPRLGSFAVPVSLVALLVTVLFKDRAGFATSGLLVLLLAILPGARPLDLTALWLLCLATVVSVRRIQIRSQFYQIIGFLTVYSVVLFVVVRSILGRSVLDTGSEFLAALLTPAIAVAFALFLLPLAELLVGISSDLTLLELSDLNHPLLKRMAIEAPGTYHHSQVVGQLAEQAARAIGANALQVRVGALFHDIGKLNKSEYFVENQGPGQRGNKHDELSPSMSALIIASHVREGIELARRWRLPKEVIDFIPEHHGTQVMEYFYHKALEAEGNETVKVDDFRYPGPKPRRRETAVLMLADAVEAATRSLAKPTPSRIKEITKQICDKRMLSGELDESNLTLSDLARIREAFIPLLTGIHHARIAYPGQRAREDDRREPRSVET